MISDGKHYRRWQHRPHDCPTHTRRRRRRRRCVALHIPNIEHTEKILLHQIHLTPHWTRVVMSARAARCSLTRHCRTIIVFAGASSSLSSPSLGYSRRRLRVLRERARTHHRPAPNSRTDKLKMVVFNSLKRVVRRERSEQHDKKKILLDKRFLKRKLRVKSANAQQLFRRYRAFDIVSCVSDMTT